MIKICQAQAHQVDHKFQIILTNNFRCVSYGQKSSMLLALPGEHDVVLHKVLLRLQRDRQGRL